MEEEGSITRRSLVLRSKVFVGGGLSETEKQVSTAVTSSGYDLSDSHFPLLRIKNRPLYYDWLLSAW